MIIKKIDSNKFECKIKGYSIEIVISFKLKGKLKEIAKRINKTEEEFIKLIILRRIKQNQGLPCDFILHFNDPDVIKHTSN